MVDAVVVGAGPNGLVAANTLADAGWDVLVLEAQPEPGGAVRSAALTLPGFRHDVFSAFYPLAPVSPALARLHLEDYGLRWLRAPLALANPTYDGRCAIISPDVDETAASLDAYAGGDGDGWRRLLAPWDRHGRELVDCLLGPFPPVRAGGRLAAKLRARDLLELARTGLVPVRRMAEEHFAGEGGALLLAGNALHTDLSPESAGSGFFGWLLCCLAQRHGFPVPEGGAGELTAALVARLASAGGQVRCDSRATRVEVRNGRAVGVEVDSGETILARRAVVADVTAPHLYGTLLAGVDLPVRLRADLERFQWDTATVKVDWALSGPIPWTCADACRAGTLHLADSLDDLSRWATSLVTRTVPADPFLVFGQQSVTDPTRQPPGAETAWAYTHVPRDVARDEAGAISGRWDDVDAEAMVERIEARVERVAPGFRRLVIGRHVIVPPAFAAADANLDLGAINGGTAQLYQQLVFRPTPGTGRPGTAVDGLYLASASAHPGGGVHGACGHNAASAALTAARIRRW